MAKHTGLGENTDFVSNNTKGHRNLYTQVGLKPSVTKSRELLLGEWMLSDFGRVFSQALPSKFLLLVKKSGEGLNRVWAND